MWDFNGDGYEDHASSYVTNPDHPSAAGGVTVLYGSATGLVLAHHQNWTPRSPGLDIGDPDSFGFALAGGDFDGDGYAELAIGAPVSSGAVIVLSGSPKGLTARHRQRWTLDTPGILGRPFEYDYFGSSLVAADFDLDGYADLAITSQQPADGPAAVSVLYGSAHGLTATRNQRWTGAEIGSSAGAHVELQPTESAVVGDFGRDGHPDLAVAAAVGAGKDSSGGAVVLYGQPGGLSLDGAQAWSIRGRGIRRGGEPGGDCVVGTVLAAGDFGRSGQADLAIGEPEADQGAGVVHILYGSNDGLTAQGNQLWSQGSPGVEGDPVTGSEDGEGVGDGFGAGLAAADFGRGGQADLAVYAECEANYAGGINVLYGSPDGLRARGNQYWTFVTVPGGIIGAPAHAGYFVAGTPAGLVLDGDGSISVLNGSADGLTSSGGSHWTRRQLGIQKYVE